jgi:undecaprenyl phosphate-alpha-L-ara4FN deformylase
MNKKILAFKVDVDTEVGTRLGVPKLVSLFEKYQLPATFFFSLGPDHTGRSIFRVFQKGFLKKVTRTKVASIYGIRTLLNGTLLPGPMIGKVHRALLQNIKQRGFEVGIHAYDHTKWQNKILQMSRDEVAREFFQAISIFKDIFQSDPIAAAAPGWIANANTLSVYDQAGFRYGSDCRGRVPFIPKVGTEVFKTLQIPTTLPTLDEMVGKPDVQLQDITNRYLSLIAQNDFNVMTIHAELEGGKYSAWFENLLQKISREQILICDLKTIADNYLIDKNKIPVNEMILGEVPDRGGELAMQGN